MFSYVPQAGVFEPKNNTSNNLTTTHDLRDLKYRANGTGRDGYAHFNNGGMQIDYKPAPVGRNSPSGKFLPQVHKKPGIFDSNYALAVKYRPDGTGRDYYIKHENGGYSHATRPQDPRVTFKQNLRNYNQISDYLTKRRFDSKNLSAGPQKKLNLSPKVTRAQMNDYEQQLGVKKRLQTLKDEPMMPYLTSNQFDFGSPDKITNPRSDLHKELRHEQLQKRRQQAEALQQMQRALDVNNQILTTQNEDIYKTIDRFAPEYNMKKNGASRQTHVHSLHNSPQHNHQYFQTVMAETNTKRNSIAVVANTNTNKHIGSQKRLRKYKNSVPPAMTDDTNLQMSDNPPMERRRSLNRYIENQVSRLSIPRAVRDENHQQSSGNLQTLTTSPSNKINNFKINSPREHNTIEKVSPRLNKNSLQQQSYATQPLGFGLLSDEKPFEQKVVMSPKVTNINDMQTYQLSPNGSGLIYSNTYGEVKHRGQGR